MSASKQVDIIIVGAGFAGMYALHRLRGLGFSVQVFEAGSDVGGTWYWNRYPGARCDVNSLEYSYQFSNELQQQWNWSEKYAAQVEILAYARHVAERFQLRSHIQFETRVESMCFDENRATWQVNTNRNDSWEAKFCIAATGCLSKPNYPVIEGLQDFQGQLLHTGLWPEVTPDFRGRRLVIIGTGSSAIQAIPLLAQEADSLTVLQRTASFSVPAHNAKMDPAREQQVKANYANFRAQNSQRYAALDNNPNPQSALELDPVARHAVFEQRWQQGGLPFLASFNDLAINPAANQTAVEFIHEKIHDLVQDPDVAAKLCPETVLGCKRLCVDTDYYQTFNRTNVELVDLGDEPISRVSSTGIVIGNREIAVDVIILATGFDAMTGALLAIDVRGRKGQSLVDKWQHGPRNYLGLAINGFPNLFMITGPGSPSVLANMIVAIEQHVDWIATCLQFLRSNAVQFIEADSDAERDWIAHVNEVADRTLYANSCNSWYTGANIPGKPRLFMPYLGYPAYVSKCEAVATSGYQGFQLGR